MVKVPTYTEFKKQVVEDRSEQGFVKLYYEDQNLGIFSNQFTTTIFDSIIDTDYLYKELFTDYLALKLGSQKYTSIHWDIYVDERKDGSKITDLGFLCISRNLSSQFFNSLLQISNSKWQSFIKSNGSARKSIGEIHWKKMDWVQHQVALEWLERFFNGPMIFFVYYPQLKSNKSRVDLIHEVVQRLEDDQRVPKRLQREKTTVHVDYDSSDVKDLWKSERLFRLLRVFPWDSKGSPLLQLTDILLNICSYKHKNLTIKNNSSTSNSGLRKIALLEAADNYIKKGRKNIIGYFEDGTTNNIFN